MKKVKQASTETPFMSKWDKVELTPNNVVEYFSQLKYYTEKYPPSLGYFKTYIEIDDGDTQINRRYDSDELGKLEELLIKYVLEDMSIQELFSLPQFKKLTEELIEYGNLVEEGLSFLPTGLGEVRLYKLEQSVTGNLTHVVEGLQEDMIVSKLVDKGIKSEDAKIIQTLDLAQRIINDQLLSGDVEMIGFLINQTEFDEETLTTHQKHELNKIRLDKYNPEVNALILEHWTNIQKCSSRDDVEFYMQENGLEIINSHELIPDGYGELSHRFVRTDKMDIMRSYDYNGYNIIESKIGDVPVFIDPQTLDMQSSLESVMKHVEHFNRPMLLQNLRHFYLDNMNEVKFNDLESIVITDLMKEYYGMDILRERNRILETESVALKDYQTVDKLINDIRTSFEGIPLLESAIITPSLNSDGEHTLQIDTALNDIVLAVTTDSYYLSVAKDILEITHDKVDLPRDMLDDMLERIDELDSKFENLVEAELMQLSNIGKRLSGDSGFQFQELKYVVDNFSNMKTGDINIVEYLGSKIADFQSKEIDDTNVMDVMQLLEIANEYAKTKNLTFADIPNSHDCVLQVLEPPIYQVMKWDKYDAATTNMFGFEITAFTEEFQQIVNDATVEIIRPYYESFLDDTEMSEIIYYQSDGLDIYSDYKFLNEENTICFRNLDWFNPQIEVSELLSNAQAFLDDGCQNEEQVELLKYMLEGNELSYWNEKGVKQSLLDDFYKLQPPMGEIRLNIEEKHLDLLNEVKDASKLLYEYHNNGLCNAITFPDYNHWEQFYAEDIDVDGEILQEERMSYDEYYDEELKINSGYECEALDKAFSIIDDKRIEYSSDTLFAKEISSIFENNLTEKLENAQSIIRDLNMKLDYTTNEIDRVFDKINNSQEEMSTIEKFDLICNSAYCGKEPLTSDWLKSIEDSEVMKTGLNIIVNDNLSKLGESTLMFQTITHNMIGAPDEYKLASHRTQQFFERNSNIDSDELKVLLLGVEDIDNHVRVGMDIGSGHYQLLQLACKDKYSEININDICYMDTKSLDIAKDIIKLKVLSTDVESAKRLEAATLIKEEVKLENEL